MYSDKSAPKLSTRSSSFINNNNKNNSNNNFNSKKKKWIENIISEYQQFGESYSNYAASRENFFSLASNFLVSCLLSLLLGIENLTILLSSEYDRSDIQDANKYLFLVMTIIYFFIGSFAILFFLFSIREIYFSRSILPISGHLDMYHSKWNNPLTDRQKLVKKVTWILLNLVVNAQMILKTIVTDCANGGNQLYAICSDNSNITAFDFMGLVLFMPIAGCILDFNRTKLLTILLYSISVFSSVAVTLIACLRGATSAYYNCTFCAMYILLSLIVLVNLNLQYLQSFHLFQKYQSTLADNSAKQSDALRQMVGNVAHDMRTPLASFVNGVSMIEQAILDIKAKFAAQQMNQIVEMGENNSAKSNNKIFAVSRGNSAHLNQSMDTLDFHHNRQFMASKVNVESKESGMVASNQTKKKSDWLREIEESIDFIEDCTESLNHTNQFMVMMINRCVDYMKITNVNNSTQKTQNLNKENMLVAMVQKIDIVEALRQVVDCMNKVQDRIHIRCLLDGDGFSTQEQLHLNRLLSHTDSCRRSRMEGVAVCHCKTFVFTDRQWLQDNLLCLVSNAVKYSTRAGADVIVRVTLSRAAKLPAKGDFSYRQQEKPATTAEKPVKSTQKHPNNTTHVRKLSFRAKQENTNKASKETSSVSARITNSVYHQFAINFNYGNNLHLSPRSPMNRKGIALRENYPMSPRNQLHSAQANHQNPTHSTAIDALRSIRVLPLQTDDDDDHEDICEEDPLHQQQEPVHENNNINDNNNNNNDNNNVNNSNNDKNHDSAVNSKENSIRNKLKADLLPPPISIPVVHHAHEDSSTNNTGNNTANNSPCNHAQSPRQSPSHMSNLLRLTTSRLESFHLTVEVIDSGNSLFSENPNAVPASVSGLFQDPSSQQGARRTGGTGLGLFSLAKRVEALHGDCGVRARLRSAANDHIDDTSSSLHKTEGNIFWFSVPVMKSTNYFYPNQQSNQFTVMSHENTISNAMNNAVNNAVHNAANISQEFKSQENSLREQVTSMQQRALSSKQSVQSMNYSDGLPDTRDDDNTIVTNNLLHGRAISNNTLLKASLIATTPRESYEKQISSQQLQAKSIDRTEHSRDAQREMILPTLDDSEKLQPSNSENSAMNNLQNQLEQKKYRNRASFHVSNTSNTPASTPATSNKPSLRRANSTLSTTEQESAAQPARKLSILVVDDSPSILKMTSMMLRRQGHEIEVAENGEMALQRIRDRLAAEDSTSAEHASQTAYDVILMDLQMPVLDGLEATKRIRDSENNIEEKHAQHTEDSHAHSCSRENSSSNQETSIGGKSRRHQLIIGVSASSDAEVTQQAEAVGMDSFLAKPFSIKVFQETYSNLLAKR